MGGSGIFLVIIIGLVIIGYGIFIIKTGRTKLIMRGLGDISEIPIEGGCARIVGVFYIILGIGVVAFILGAIRLW